MWHKHSVSPSLHPSGNALPAPFAPPRSSLPSKNNRSEKWEEEERFTWKKGALIKHLARTIRWTITDRERELLMKEEVEEDEEEGRSTRTSYHRCLHLPCTVQVLLLSLFYLSSPLVSSDPDLLFLLPLLPPSSGSGTRFFALSNLFLPSDEQPFFLSLPPFLPIRSFGPPVAKNDPFTTITRTWGGRRGEGKPFPLP